MTDERRYGEGEIDEIFARAADESIDPATGRPRRDGLTLAELQEIGEEAGLSRERVAEAAASVEAVATRAASVDAAGGPGAAGARAGGATRYVQLHRTPTDREWELLVTELRATFGAAGVVLSRGETREWRDGDLHVFVEPSADGTRLRMTDERSPNAVLGLFGWGVLLIGAVLLVTRGLDAATFGAVWEVLLPTLMVAAGGGSLAGVAWRQRKRAELREGQMARITARARELTGAEPG